MLNLKILIFKCLLKYKIRVHALKVTYTVIHFKLIEKSIKKILLCLQGFEVNFLMLLIFHNDILKAFFFK